MIPPYSYVHGRHLYHSHQEHHFPQEGVADEETQESRVIVVGASRDFVSVIISLLTGTCQIIHLEDKGILQRRPRR